MGSVNSSALQVISFVSFKTHNNSITAAAVHVFDIINDCLERATAIELNSELKGSNSTGRALFVFKS